MIRQDGPRPARGVRGIAPACSVPAVMRRAALHARDRIAVCGVFGCGDRPMGAGQEGAMPAAPGTRQRHRPGEAAAPGCLSHRSRGFRPDPAAATGSPSRVVPGRTIPLPPIRQHLCAAAFADAPRDAAGLPTGRATPCHAANHAAGRHPPFERTRT